MWAGDWDVDPGDDEILARAAQEGRILITLDKDFGELAIVRQQPHAGIVRLVGWSARQQAFTCLAVLSRYGTEKINPLNELLKGGCHPSGHL